MSRANFSNWSTAAAPQSFPVPDLNLTTELIRVKNQNNYDTFTISEIPQGNNPAFDLIGLTQLRNDEQFAGIDGSGFSVAVIDTGLDTSHSLIAPNYVAGYDFVDLDDNPMDLNGHGTHLAGTIAATDENIGVATDAGLISLRVLDSNGSGSIKNIVKAIDWVLAHQAEYQITAVNLSLGSGFFSTESDLANSIFAQELKPLQAGIQNLEAAGVTVIAAAGNNYFANQEQGNYSNLAFPAIVSTIAVGAVWQDDSETSAFWADGSIDYTTEADRIPSFSQRLDIDKMIFAPGAIITSTLPGNKIGDNAGTSQAVPHVAGAVALLQEASLEFSGDVLTPAEVNEILRTTGDIIFDGDDEDDNVENTNTEYIRLNIYNAIAEIKRRSPDLPSFLNDLDGIITQVESITTLPILDFTGEIGDDRGQEIGDRDVDFYRLNPGESGILEIEVESLSIDALNSVVVLFDGDGRKLGVNDQYQADDSRLKFQVTSGTDYYLGITGAGNQDFAPFILGSGNGGDIGSYQLNARIRPFTAEDNFVDHQIAHPGVQTINLGVTLFGNVGHDHGLVIGNTDVDLYRFVAVNSETINVETITGSEFGADTYLRIFDSLGEEVATNNELRQTEAGSFIQFEAIADQEYYIGVNGNSNSATTYNPRTGENRAEGGLGNYHLRLSNNSETAITSDHSQAVYQFFRSDLEVNFYTTSIAERDFITNELKQYTPQGASFTSATVGDDPLIDARPVYRFFNTSTGGHLYTISETESKFINNNLSNYRSEGVAYHGYTTAQSDTIPLYRLYNPETDIHLFTPSIADKDQALANLPHYQLEGNDGIAFYVKI